MTRSRIADCGLHGRRLVALVLLCACGIGLAAETPNYQITLTDQDDFVKVSNRGAYLLETEALSATQAHAQLREQIANSTVTDFTAFGTNNSAFWMLLDVDNQSTLDDWVLTSTNHLFRRIDAFRIAPNGAVTDIPVQPVGAGYFGMDLMRHARIGIAAGEQAALLVRLQADVMHPPYLSIQAADRARQSSNVYTILVLLCLGATAGLILYNLLIAVQLRSAVYAMYCCYGVAHLLFMLVLSGMMTWLLGHTDGELHSSTQRYSSLSLAMMLLFTFSFMNSGRQARLPRGVGGLLLLSATGLLTVCMLTFVTTTGALHLGSIFLPTFLISLFLILGVALYQWIQGFRAAGVFLLAWSVLVVAYLYTAYAGFSVDGRTLWGNLLPLVGGTIEMILLSLALGFRFIAVQQQADRARQKTVQLQVENARKTEFVQTLTHEVRAPLHSVMGALELASQSETPQAREDYLDTARYGAESLYDLVDSMLDAVNIDVQPRAQIDQHFELPRLITATVSIFEARAEAKALRLTVGNVPSVSLHGPAIVVRRTLINLVSNAIKYTPKGNIVVSAELSGAEDDIQQLTVRVDDTGPGIDDDALATLQDTSDVYSTQPSSRVGLRISQAIVEKAGGTLHLERRDTGGTCATFTVPVRTATSVEIESVGAQFRDQAHDASRDPDRGAALLVDDDAMARQLVAAELSSLGYTVTVAEDIASAAAQLFGDAAEHSEQPSPSKWALVLCDHRLPDGSGLELLQQLRIERRQNMPALLVSAALARGEASLHAHALIGVQKPAKGAVLIEAVARARLYAQVIDELEVTDGQMVSLQPADRRRVCDMYIEQTREDLHTVKSRAEDMHKRHVAAHRIASASTTIGLISARDAALDVEKILLPLAQAQRDQDPATKAARLADPAAIDGAIARLELVANASISACRLVRLRAVGPSLVAV